MKLAIFSVIANLLAIALLSQEIGYYYAETMLSTILAIFWVISAVGLALALAKLYRIGGILIIVGSLIFVPLGLIAVFGGRNIMLLENPPNLAERRKALAQTALSQNEASINEQQGFTEQSNSLEKRNTTEPLNHVKLQHPAQKNTITEMPLSEPENIFYARKNATGLLIVSGIGLVLFMITGATALGVLGMSFVFGLIQYNSKHVVIYKDHLVNGAKPILFNEITRVEANELEWAIHYKTADNQEPQLHHIFLGTMTQEDKERLIRTLTRIFADKIDNTHLITE